MTKIYKKKKTIEKIVHERNDFLKMTRFETDFSAAGKGHIVPY